ncbi:MAG: M3 family oligoendopeptidase [Actinomycetota bacterium]
MVDTEAQLEETTWDLEPLVDGTGSAGVDELLDAAKAKSAELAKSKGRIGEFDGAGLASFMDGLAEVYDLVGRAGTYAALAFSADMSDEALGALMQKVQERSTEIETELLFFMLEWAKLPDDEAEELLAHEGLDQSRHHLRSARRYRDYLLSEPEEKILSEKDVTGASAFDRLFGELVSALEIEVDGETVGLEKGLSYLFDPDREVRKRAAEAVTAGLKPGLKTRAYILNTLLHDKAVNDRLRGYRHWLQSRNLSNEASDESVEALVAAVRNRYDIPKRWYALKTKILGLDRLADYDRSASLATDDQRVEWSDAKAIVHESYASFSEELADLVQQFYDKRWIDAPPTPGKRPGAFCSYAVPSRNPYVMLNYTSRRRDVLVLAHELGHGVHGALARKQGIFHQSTPLTVAETASVFGETVVFERLLGMEEDPAGRLSLLAENVEGAIATVFRQTAMNRFEHLVHTARREDGELPVERINEAWVESQVEMLGDDVEITDGYRIWWSYVPHFISTPGYVYAYSYGQLLALSVYKQYQDQGEGFVPRYLEMLSAGGSMPPEELGKIVDCDLADPGFWDGGLSIVGDQLKAAEAAAKEAGRLD